MNNILNIFYLFCR